MARSADPLSYAAVVTYVYFAGIPYGVLRPDDRAVREIEEALRMAERSGDDLALAFTRATLGLALVHHQTAAERDRGHKLLAKISEVLYNLCDLPIVEVYLARERARRGGRADAVPLMRRRRPSVPARDNCWRGAFRRRVFWWRHCSITAPRVTWSKPRPRSHDWRRRRPTTVWLCATSGYCGCAPCWPRLTATREATATIAIATALWRHRWALRGTWSGPRRCHDGGRPGKPTPSRNRRDTRVSKPRVGFTVNANGPSWMRRSQAYWDGRCR